MINELYSIFEGNSWYYYRGSGYVKPLTNDLYIPYNFFKNTNYKNDIHFKDSKVLGRVDNSIYTMYIDTASGTNKGTAYIYKINFDDYSISNYIMYNQHLINIVCKSEYYNSGVKYGLCVLPTDSRTFENFSAYFGVFHKDLFSNKNNMVVDTYFNFKVGTNYLDDFMYSNKSTDIFIMGLYFFIPILLFILAIKVLRKGLFK